MPPHTSSRPPRGDAAHQGDVTPLLLSVAALVALPVAAIATAYLWPAGLRGALMLTALAPAALAPAVLALAALLLAVRRPHAQGRVVAIVVAGLVLFASIVAVLAVLGLAVDPGDPSPPQIEPA